PLRLAGPDPFAADPAPVPGVGRHHPDPWQRQPQEGTPGRTAGADPAGTAPAGVHPVLHLRTDEAGVPSPSDLTFPLSAFLPQPGRRKKAPSRLSLRARYLPLLPPDDGGTGGTARVASCVCAFPSGS